MPSECIYISVNLNHALQLYMFTYVCFSTQHSDGLETDPEREPGSDPALTGRAGCFLLSFSTPVGQGW